MDTWKSTAYQMFVDSVRWARMEHERWLGMSSEEKAGMEQTFVLGSINPVPKASDTIAAHMRVNFIDAISNFISIKMTRAGIHQVYTILLYVIKILLPSTEYSRLGIAKDVIRPPCNGAFQDLTYAIAWLEDFFNRYTVAMTVKVMLEPKEVLAFVYNN
eukprot:4135740-Amphidinium_carterae.1